MHFTLSNLLYDFSNSKYMLFSLLKKIHIKNTGQLDLTYNPIDPNPFNPQDNDPFWPTTGLSQPSQWRSHVKTEGGLGPPKIFQNFHIYMHIYELFRKLNFFLKYVSLLAPHFIKILIHIYINRINREGF